MENPAFLDSDQSVYESTRGPGSSTPLTMSQRRQHHLPSIHSAHGHAPRGGGGAGGGGGGGGMGASQHVTHVHNGRVLGVTGVPGGMVHGGMVPGTIVQVSSVPGAPPGGIHSTTTTTSLYPDPSMPPLYSGHLNSPPSHEYLYSCEAPRGHDHVYQCPGHRGDQLDHRDHHLEHRQRHIDLREQQQQHPQHHHLESRSHPEMDPRDHHYDPTLDQRPDYHYGGSDYSSTEPIYAQPHLFPREGSAGTPTLGYNNARASLRAASAASSHLSAGTTMPAKYLVRSDSCGNSTSSSTLPTVSALLSREAAHTPPTPTHNTTTQSLRSSGRHHHHHHNHHGKGGGGISSSSAVVVASTSSSSSSTPAKLKRQGLFRAWKVKFLRGEGGRRRVCLLVAVLLLVLLVLGALAAVLYLTLGGDLGAFVGESPKLVQVTETGISVVEGEFRITNQNFWSGLEDPHSEEYRAMADSIERELDTLFLGSVWAREYNHSQIVSLAEGSLLVRAQFFLNVADVKAASNLGSSFLSGLHNRHGNDWLGQYSIDIMSIRFTNVAVDPSSLSSTTQPPATEEVEEPSTPVVEVSNTTPHLNVGWGEWGPWSSCFPCSPQYDQIRTRQCHMDAGRGIIISTIEPCLPTGMGGQLEGSGGEMDSRPCQCPHINNKDASRTTITTTTTTNTPWKVEEQPQREEDRVVDVATERLCDSCLPGEVCVGLEGEPYPTCRTALDSGDRTGCGGLCAIDSEVCQALGSRAFQCHSASLCLHDEWRCDDGLCIPHIKRCDGHMNCYDQSDEQRCHCGNNQFQCGNNTSCLPATSKCDGKMDCWDGSDEVNCTTSVSVSPSSNSATGYRIVETGQMNPLDVLDGAKPTSINAGTEDASQLPASVMAGTRAGTSAMNRTAIGLSSLSHRERELLS